MRKKHSIHCVAILYYYKGIWESVWADIPTIEKNSIRFVCNAKCGAYQDIMFSDLHNILSQPTQAEIKDRQKTEDIKRFTEINRMLLKNNFPSQKKRKYYKNLLKEREEMIKKDPLIRLFS